MYRITKHRAGFLPVGWLAASALLLAIWGCGDDTPFEPTSDRSSQTSELLPVQDSSGNGQRNKATGTVEIVFRGGQGSGPPGGNQGTRLAFASIDAQEAGLSTPARGEFRYLVTNELGELHREIVATLVAVHVDVDTRKAWMLGHVTSDTKGCTGGPGGGHEEGCSSGDEGGCSGHDDGGGCDGGHDDPDGGHDGGCGDHDTGGGCDDHSGGGGCSDHGSGGGMVSGKSCRVGQVVAAKLHDDGSPAVDNDGISWKWFDAEDPGTPSADTIPDWPHLCRKTILGGNVTVHIGDPGGGGGGEN